MQETHHSRIMVLTCHVEKFCKVQERNLVVLALLECSNLTKTLEQLKPRGSNTFFSIKVVRALKLMLKN